MKFFRIVGFTEKNGTRRITAFSLRPSNTTSSGGKTLVCPTPYAVKMALLDRLIRTRGLDEALPHFDAICSLGVWVNLPEVVVVNRTFGRILRPQKSAINEGTGRVDVWKRTIVQREFCLFDGLLTFAFDAAPPLSDMLPELLAGINYFGQRGGFMQLVEWAVHDQGDLPGAEFVCLSEHDRSGELMLGFLQRMDDMRPNAEFADVDVVSGRTRSDGGRTSYTVIVPYYLQEHGPGYTVYTRDGVHVS